jgi:hypothetical protein
MTSIAKNIKNDEKGQILLFVIISMSIALAIGVAISTRTLSSLQRVTRTDTASKVYSGAEGGAEAFIVLPDNFLEDVIDTSNNISTLCGTYGWSAAPDTEGRGCIIEYEDPETSTITKATVTVEYFKTNEIVGSDAALAFYLDEGSTQEVLIQKDGTSYNSSMKLCWDNSSAHLYVVGYNDKGIDQRFKKIAVPSGGSVSEYDPQFSNNLVTANAPAYPNYPHCYQLDANPWFNSATDKPYGLRVRALRNSTNVVVVPTNLGLGNFPNQGFLVTSSAEIASEGITKSVKTVKVYKTYSYLPNIFDYAIYSEGPIVN